MHIAIGSGPITTTTTNGGKAVCTVTYGSETVNPVSYSNSGSGFVIKWEFNNLKVTTSGGFFNCGVADGEHTGGSYTGSSLISGVDTAGKAVVLSFS